MPQTTDPYTPALGSSIESGPVAGTVPAQLDLYRQSNLTINQLRVWVGQALVPETPIYHLAGALTLHGEINSTYFEQAFQVLINSSDALRTIVQETDGIPSQRVLREVSYPLEVVDFSHLHKPQATVRSWMETRCQTPFNLQERLFDSALIKLSAKEFVWYLNVHHLVCDGWSFELIYRHMADLYRRCLQGQPLNTLPLFPYAEYVAHERVYRESVRYRKAEAYWKQRLAADDGAPISFYGRTPQLATTRTRRVSHQLTTELAHKLRVAVTQASSEPETVSLLHIFTAILLGYIHSLNRKQSYTVGIPFHNRRSKAFKETLGFFSEILPVRFDVSDDDTLASLIAKVRREIQKAVRHGQHSIANPYFEKVYEIVVNYHNRSFCDFAGISAYPEWIHNGHGDDSLALQIHDFGASGGVVLDFDLHESIFSQRESQQAASHCLRVLENFLNEPGQPLSALTLLSPEETRETIKTWSHGTHGIVDVPPVHKIFEEQASQRPSDTAVLYEDQSLTYQELNQRSNRLARYLRRRGVGPQTLVSLCVERSLEMLVGLLGILKAGAAYVPLDPAYPSDWLKSILGDIRAPLLLTQRSLISSLAQEGIEAICLDSISETLDRESEANLDSQVTGEDLAYVVFTSGSTGAPKGVEIQHKALANFANHAGRYFGLQPGDRFLQFAPISFDTAAEEIFPCLTHGATLILRTDSMLESASAFLETCRNWRTTVLDLPTSYWHELSARLFSEGLVMPDPIRLVIIGGERAIPERLTLWRSCVSKRIRLLNTYGPTETTVAATMCDLTHEDSDSFVEVPIGQPISNVQTYVLNQSLNPVPAGVAGELCIGGVGLARGYLNRPDLTAEKFVANPFDSKPGSRLYKTGDLVRYHPDGTLEFLGRIDHQVKIRGFRVELQAIEAVLRKHPLVQDVAVVQDGSSSQRPLIAYLVAQQSANLNRTELTAFAMKQLPEYMIPNLFVVMESLPLTPTGKVDRKALSLLEGRRDKPAKIHIPPRTHTEQQIARIWAEVLGLERVGRDDHLFELGGHSLVAIQVVSRIRKELKVDIPLRAIFEAPTVAEFAQRIETAELDASRPGENHSGSVIQPSSNIPLSFSQARIWFMDQLAPESSAYNIVATIRFTGRMQKEALRRSVNEVVRRHDSLRTTFRKNGDELIQVATPELVLELPEIDLNNLSEDARLEEAKRISRQEARRPFELERGPLIRVLLIRLDEEDQILLLNIHHAICDQWSLGVIAREVTSFYSTFCKASTASLEAAPVQYSDFALWQGEWLTGPRLESDLLYWKTKLADLQPLQLPTDHPRPSVQTFRGAHLQLSLSKEIVEGLKKLGVQETATLYMLFLTAFKTLLFRYSGQHDITVGSPIANRNRIEWEGVVGTFINVLVLRTDLAGKPTFREALRRVRQMVLDAFSHQELPFEKLVEQLQPKRDPGRPPLFNVLFNFHHLHPGKIDLEDLSWVPFEIDTWASQFDISVTVDPEITRKVWVAYNTDLYEPNTIARMLGHYQHLLEQIVDDPDRSIENFSILTEPERRQIIHEWNHTEAFYPPSCLHELFEAQARKTPDSVASAFEGRQLSYRELAQGADRVARRLQSMGVTLDTRVGICMERSLELVIGLLGTLKAGGAYVPIDPAYPSERIAFMVEDSKMPVLLTQERLLKQIPRNGYQILTIEELTEKTAPASAENLLPAVSPQNLAYVIYTSGSTGIPKGVEIEHGSLVNFLHSMRDKIGISDQDTLLSVTTISFDIAALELFLPLTVGARIVLVSREVATDGRRLLEQLEKSDVTMMQATPATWRMLLEASWEGDSRLKILCGGEGLSSELAKALLQRGGALWNLYGPTETTVWSTARQINFGDGRISIGKPVANTEVYLLDSNLEPVPIGVVGELYIGGMGLARGYLNHPDLTAERFISNPFNDDSKARLYRTGDLARYLPDGNVEFMGRKDYQVKIRGFRVEPREVEVALCQHPAVKQGVVLAREDVPGNKRLVAYVIRHGQQALPITDLRNFLKSKLPEHMVPSTFVFLDGLPLTPNGKVDRRALPMPDQARPELEEIFVAPRTPVEKCLATVWADILQLDEIGVHDNFFDLGGHSLLATRVISKVRQAFSIELPLLALFENPTVATLAAEVARIQAEGVIPQEMATELSALESLSEEEAQKLLRPRDPQKIQRASNTDIRYNRS